jgi:hypothetical protein
LNKKKDMKLLGSNEDTSDANRPQIRTQDDASAVGYGFHQPQENEFPAPFVPKRWAAPADDIVEVGIIITPEILLFS